MTLNEFLYGRTFVVERKIYHSRPLKRLDCNGDWIEYDIKDTNSTEVILSVHGASSLGRMTNEGNTVVHKIFVKDQEIKDLELPVQQEIFFDVCRLYTEQEQKKAEEERAKIEQKKSMVYQELFKQIQK